MTPSAQGGVGGLRDLNLTNKRPSSINNRYGLVHFARINTLIFRENEPYTWSVSTNEKEITAQNGSKFQSPFITK
jgi:hypothetical protein